MCHIHIGYEPKRVEVSEKIIKYLDLYLGVPSVIYDTDVRRRAYYGNAGSFRLQNWGVEYRTLSGFFLKDENTLRWVHRQTNKAIQALLEGKPLPNPDEVVAIINNTNSDDAIQRAKKLMREFNV